MVRANFSVLTQYILMYLATNLMRKMKPDKKDSNEITKPDK